MSEKIIYWLILKSIPGIGDVKIKKLYDEFSDPEYIVNEALKEKLKENFPDKSLLNKIKEDAKKELERTEKNNIKIITYDNELYPDLLKNIYAPPPLLYALGNLKILKKKERIAIIGSRNPSDYGKSICKEVTKELVNFDIITVSGFAKGIDTITHKITIDENGETIAVLGCGVNIIYPASNKKLYYKIKENGLILSEFSLDTKPEAPNFPKRNRIISGLSKGVVVIEAGKKSGTLITAEFAINQGREVFAFPGNIYNYKSKGTHYLIKNGAYLVENAKDIIEVIFPYKLNKKTKKKKKDLDLKIDDPVIEKIFNIIKEEPKNFDQLLLQSGLKPEKLLTIITEMEIMGIIDLINNKYIALK